MCLLYGDNLEKMGLTGLSMVGSMVILRWEAMRENVGPCGENCKACMILHYW